MPHAVRQGRAQRAAVRAPVGQRPVAKPPRRLGPRRRRGHRRQRVARGEERIADAPARPAGDHPHPRVRVAQPGDDVRVGGVTPIFRDQDSADEGRVRARLRQARRRCQQQEKDPESFHQLQRCGRVGRAARGGGEKLVPSTRTGTGHATTSSPGCTRPGVRRARCKPRIVVAANRKDRHHAEEGGSSEKSGRGEPGSFSASIIPTRGRGGESTKARPVSRGAPSPRAVERISRARSAGGPGRRGRDR